MSLCNVHTVNWTEKSDMIDVLDLSIQLMVSNNKLVFYAQSTGAVISGW